MNKQLNILAAEALSLRYAEFDDCIKIQPHPAMRGFTKVFDLSDSNCRDLVIEHFKVTVEYDSMQGGIWMAYVMLPKAKNAYDKSRDKAIDKCIEKCLKEKSDE